MTREDAIKQTLKDIETMEAVNAILPQVKKVIEKWNGKMLNKRIEADLKVLDLPGHIYFATSDENRFYIQYSPAGHNQWFTLLHTMRPSNKYFDPEKSFIDSDKRISREKAFQQIEAGRVERLQKITEYKLFLETYEDKLQKIAMLKKQLSTLTESIPYTLIDYFGLKHRYY
jgi:hypothetical protein